MTNTSPKDFLKARRPERFSDSVWEDTSDLDKPLLEYQLETLTNRGQETEFERFARRLAQREICPNLLPQTGPTGGGDSKVDSETYPVADDLALAWIVGSGSDAGSERWAFAFSAKADWRPKVKSDIEKIAATGRDYAKAFFISSRFIPDRVRAQVEDELREKHGIDVRIFDRSWIIDRIFGGRHQTLAIEELGLPQSMEPQVRKGPLDLERERELDIIESRIKVATEQGRFGFECVDDCAEASTLARSLELPRNEVEGRLVRSQQMAEKYGTQHQKLESAYQLAWTAFWWFEDLELLVKQYMVVESHAMGSQNPYDFELLSNLLIIIYPLMMNGDITEELFNHKDHTYVLTRELERLAEDQVRPTAALQARTLLLRIRLITNLENPDPVLREIQAVVSQCEGMVGYPLEPLIEIVKELGDFIGDNPVYDELFNTTVDVASTREGEVTGARMLLHRGAQQLKADQPYEAIRTLGRVLTRLSKHESRKDLIRALLLCSSAYERVGLLWAARGTAIVASSVATNDFWSYGDVTPLQAACYHQVGRLEVQLGRLPQILAWHQVYFGIMGVLVEKGYDVEWPGDAEIQFDAILGMRFLKADLAQLKPLTRLPDVLDNLDLFVKTPRQPGARWG